MKQVPNELVVGLGRGRELAIMDTSMFSKGGSSDPRCLFWIPGVDVIEKSKVIRKCLDPCWREVFYLEMPPSLENPVLKVRCEDYDDASAADFMGGLELPLKEYSMGIVKRSHRLTTRAWLALEPDPKHRKVKVTGEIELFLWARHNPELAFEPFQEPDRHKLEKCNELRVALIRGKDLAAKDADMLGRATSSDPRVIFEVLGTELALRSSTKDKTLAPRWNEVFEFEFEEGMAATDKPLLKCTCQDHDRFSAPDFMGCSRRARIFL